MERARDLAASTARQRPAKVYSSYSFHRSGAPYYSYSYISSSSNSFYM